VTLHRNINDDYDDDQTSIGSKTNTSIVHHLVISKAAHFIVEPCKQALISMNTVRNIPSDREDCQAQNEVKAANRIVGIAILL
jgi:hypothetical protein